MQGKNYEVKDFSLAGAGNACSIEYAERQMGALLRVKGTV